MDEKVYEHEVITTVRITVRSLDPMLNKERFLEDYNYLTDFSVLLGGEDYPRVVQTFVISDEIEYIDREIQDA